MKKPTIKKKTTVTIRQLVIITSLFFLLVIAVGYIASYTEIPATSIYDERPDRIDAYFTKHTAPLAGYGQTFVTAADSCGMDWRLLPAIAMQESSGGKRMIHNNPFGWGGGKIPFESFEDAIIQVGAHVCGTVPSTARWYNTTSTQEKLHWYNGTVSPTYPAKVQWIMEQI
jgi:hypothetical protein